MRVQICRTSDGAVVHEEYMSISTSDFVEFDKTLTLLPNTNYEVRIDVEYTYQGNIDAT